MAGLEAKGCPFLTSFMENSSDLSMDMEDEGISKDCSQFHKC